MTVKNSGKGKYFHKSTHCILKKTQILLFKKNTASYKPDVSVGNSAKIVLTQNR